MEGALQDGRQRVKGIGAREEEDSSRERSEERELVVNVCCLYLPLFRGNHAIRSSAIDHIPPLTLLLSVSWWEPVCVCICVYMCCTLFPFRSDPIGCKMSPLCLLHRNEIRLWGGTTEAENLIISNPTGMHIRTRVSGHSQKCRLIDSLTNHPESYWKSELALGDSGMNFGMREIHPQWHSP